VLPSENFVSYLWWHHIYRGVFRRPCHLGVWGDYPRI